MKVNVDVLDGDITDNVPDSPFTVHCCWRWSGRNQDDMQGFIVTIDYQQCDATSDSIKCCPPLIDMLMLALEHLNKCRSTRTMKGCTANESLRAFIRTDYFSAAELCQG